MSVTLGRDLLLKVHDGSAYVTVAGLRTKSVKLNARPVDVTDSGSGGWTDLLPEAGVRSVAVTVAGVFRDAASDALVRSAFFAGSALDVRMILPGFGTMETAAQVTSLTYGGTYKGEATFELALASSGPVTFIPA